MATPHLCMATFARTSPGVKNRVPSHASLSIPRFPIPPLSSLLFPSPSHPIPSDLIPSHPVPLHRIPIPFLSNLYLMPIQSLSHFYPIPVPFLSNPCPIPIPSLSHPYPIPVPSLSHPCSIPIPSLSDPYPIPIRSLSHPAQTDIHGGSLPRVASVSSIPQLEPSASRRSHSRISGFVL